MKKLLSVAGGLVAICALAAGGGLVWARSVADTRLARTYETHRVAFPIPFPLSAEEVDALRAERAAASPSDPVADPTSPPPDPLAGVDLDAIARERAIARGDHLVHARYACLECHGENLGGGVMVDDPAMGTLLGPNLTEGEGSVTVGFAPSDWDRAVRHGVRHDGLASVMPAQDFKGMSDRELSDLIVWIRAQPPVDNVVPQRTFGPLGVVLIATNQLHTLAEELPDHHAAHRVEPPAVGATVEYGEHLAQVCTGCHRADLSGGPILGGDPSWPPAANLTPGPDGLAGWTYEDFHAALREGKARDGSMLREPMALFPKFAANMTETELQATWAYLQSVPPRADGT